MIQRLSADFSGVIDAHQTRNLVSGGCILDGFSKMFGRVRAARNMGAKGGFQQFVQLENDAVAGGELALLLGLGESLQGRIMVRRQAGVTRLRAIFGVSRPPVAGWTHIYGAEQAGRVAGRSFTGLQSGGASIRIARLSPQS